MQDWPWGHWCHGCPRGVLVPQLGLQVRALQEGMEEHGGAFGSQIQPSQGRSGKMGSLPASQQPHQGKGWPQDRAGTSPQQGREAGARAGREWGAGGGSSHTQHLKEGQLPPQSGSQDPRSPAAKHPAAAGKERSTHPASSWVCPQLLLRRGRPR